MRRLLHEMRQDILERIIVDSLLEAGVLDAIKAMLATVDRDTDVLLNFRSILEHAQDYYLDGTPPDRGFARSNAGEMLDIYCKRLNSSAARRFYASLRDGDPRWRDWLEMRQEEIRKRDTGAA